jgi:hypothetical protein
MSSYKFVSNKSNPNKEEMVSSLNLSIDLNDKKSDNNSSAVSSNTENLPTKFIEETKYVDEKVITCDKSKFSKNQINGNTIFLNFSKYHKSINERNKIENDSWRHRHLYSSSEEDAFDEQNSVAPDDDFDSYDEWSDTEDDNVDTYDPSEFDRHRS